MSELDAFNDENAGEEVDPAADFLAREQSELAGLQDDNFEVVDNHEQPSNSNGNAIVDDHSGSSTSSPFHDLFYFYRQWVPFLKV